MAGYSVDWGTALLQKLGAPVTDQNLLFLAAWAQAERGTAAYNPFNTTQGASGASNYNSVGVKNYQSAQQGLDATYQTLTNGYYGSILTALRQGNSAMAAAQAVASTPWGTGSLIEKVLGGKVSTPPQSTPGGVTANATPASASSPIAQSTLYAVSGAAPGYGVETAGFDWNPLNWPGEMAGQAGKATGDAIGDAIRGLAPALELPLEAGLQGAFMDIMKPVITFIWGGMEVMIGGFMMFWGLYLFAKKSEIGQDVIRAGMGQVPGVSTETGNPKALDTSDEGFSARLAKRTSTGGAITWSSPKRRNMNERDNQIADHRDNELAQRRAHKAMARAKGANVQTKDMPTSRAKATRAKPPTAAPEAGAAGAAEAIPVVPF